MRLNLFGAPTDNTGSVLGCSVCPLNKVPGLHKVKNLDRIHDQKAFLWAQSPGANENKQGLELVGASGTLLWETMGKIGLKRSMFAVQNVLRCRPIYANEDEHVPLPRELACCSPYNEEAIQRNHGSARVHLILGDVAALQLLGKKNFRKDKPVFWYPPWDAYVVLSWHPSYILRMGGSRAGKDYYSWRDRFRAVKAAMNHPGRWGYLKAQDYHTVRTLAEFDQMEKHIRSEAAKSRRVSFDVEDDVVDSKRLLLIAGFGTGRYSNPKDPDSWKGRSYSVVLDHPEAGYQPSHLKELRERTKKLVEDGSIKKSLQNGSYDTNTCKEALGATLRGYDYDTQYGTFLRYSFLRSCSLENLTYLFFPEFADYKEITDPWAKVGFAKAPIDRLVLRNCGDCDITQRLEQKFSPKISQPLVEVYIHAAKTLDKMEQRGPLLDRENHSRAKKVVPGMVKELDRKLQQATGDPNFNCDASAQVAWLVYDHLGLPVPEEGRTTDKTVLELLLAQSGNHLLEIVNARRGLGRIKGTYLEGFEKSADLYGGELHTIWWLTGAVTGRLRSGKGDRAEAKGIINFQNLHNSPLLQNMLVADKNWRKALREKK